MSTQPLRLTLLALEKFYSALASQHPCKMDEILTTLCDDNAIDERSRRIVYARTMDVIRRWDWANTTVKKFLTRKCPTNLYIILLLGATEIVHPPRLPQKTINTLTNYAKNYHLKYGTMVYGVLKNIARSITDPPKEHYPTWMKKHLDYPEIIIESITSSSLDIPTLHIRNHPWNISREDFESALHTQGILYERSSYGWYILQSTAIHKLPGYHQGWFYVQDAHAACVEAWLHEIHGDMWDACGAPGGKTLAALAYPNIQPTLSDINEKRLQRARTNLSRAQAPRSPDLTVYDATTPHATGRTWDAILLDAPCSGSGQFHKHPEKKWQLTPDALRDTCLLQMQLLDTTWEQLRQGGELLYMTCSLFSCENAECITTFLEKHPDATVKPLILKGHPESHGTTLLPNDSGAGGFYMCRLLKS